MNLPSRNSNPMPPKRTRQRATEFETETTDPSPSTRGVRRFEKIVPFFLGLLLALTIFLPGEQVERGGVFHLPAILWLSAVIGVVWIKRRSPEPRWHFNRLDAVAYAFFAWVVASQLWSLLPDHGGAPRPTLNLLSAWLGMAAAWFVFRQTLRDRLLNATVLSLVLAVLGAEALTGLFQYFVTIPETQRFLEKAPEAAIRQLDPSLRPDSPEWSLLVNRLKTAGPMGTYPLTNSLGGLLGVAFLFLLALPLYQNLSENTLDRFRRDQGKGILLVAGYLALLGALGFCLLLTRCRSAFVAVAFGLVLVAADQARRRFASSLRKRLVPLLVAGLLLAAGIGILAFAAPGKAVLDGARRSLGFRLEYWAASLDMVRDHPLLGCGSGNFKQNYMRYKLPGASEEISDPHHFAVELAAVAGLPALLLFLALFGLVFWRQRRLPEGPDTESEVESVLAGKAGEVGLFLGGFLGCLLAFLLSLYGEAVIDVEAVPFAALCLLLVFTLSRCVPRPLRMPPALLGITLLVLFVHLSAAGGISVTSTAIFLWLFGALLLNGSEEGQPGRPLSGRAVFYLSVFAVFGIMVAHTAGFRPVLESQALESRVQTLSDPRERLFQLRRARDADPWSAEIRLQIASECFALWTRQPSDEHLRAETLAFQRGAIRLNPRSSGYRFIFAERLFGMAEQTGDAELRQEALRLYREAVELYPTQAKIRAPFAWALWKSGEHDEALRERTEALRLDALTPHADQKLPSPWRDILTDEIRWAKPVAPE